MLESASAATDLESYSYQPSPGKDHRGRAAGRSGARERGWHGDQVNLGAVDKEEGFVADANVARIVEIGEQGAEMSFIVGEGIVLGDQHLLVLAVPAAKPTLVRRMNAG